MSGPITWAAIGSLLPLIAAAIAFGKLIELVSRQRTDGEELKAELRALAGQVQQALRVQVQHTEQIKQLHENNGSVQRELLDLLRHHYGVGDRARGDPDAYPG